MVLEVKSGTNDVCVNEQNPHLSHYGLIMSKISKEIVE